MRPEVRKLIDWATANGWELVGADSRKHYRLRHPNGTVTVPNTPSDHRSLLNTYADIARICGRRPPKPKAARYRHTGQRAPAFSMEAVAADRARRAEAQRRAREATAQHRAWAQELEELRDAPWSSHREHNRAMWLIHQMSNLEELCDQLGFPIETTVREQP